MQAVLAVLAVIATSSVPTTEAEHERGIGLADSMARSASLLGGMELDATYRPSALAPLRLTDQFRFTAHGAPAPLDDGGGVDQDMRQILALILGFIPGFGIGHLVARDKDGFILFLIIDIALYALWWTVGGFFWAPFWYVGSALWLVVHIIQALDAYSSAGGGSIVERTRKRAVEVAVTPGRDVPLVTTRVLGFKF